jgi:hypothetical protein
MLLLFLFCIAVAVFWSIIVAVALVAEAIFLFDVVCLAAGSSESVCFVL